MNIDKPLLHKMAHLARLEVEEGHEAGLLEDLNKIVRWIDKFQEVDTTGARPLAIMSAERNVFQEDIPQASLAHDRALANAPSKDSNYFRVPQVKE